MERQQPSRKDLAINMAETVLQKSDRREIDLGGEIVPNPGDFFKKLELNGRNGNGKLSPGQERELERERFAAQVHRAIYIEG